MTVLSEFWQGFDRRARTALLIGSLLILIGAVALGAWSLRTDYQVLFADLAAQDAATMVAELDRLKVPYRLSGTGNTILVPAELVYKTRLKLVGKELPLHGAVGFELFNDSEVGMTEFAQKINYQRALQGELTRTILALDEVQSARVHLALPEQGLFKKSSAQAKASISLAAKPGKTIGNDAVQGIQRLVAAAVPDIRPEDVTIVDQHGIALTRRSAAGSEEAGSDGLDDKRAIERYLGKKVSEVLERSFGEGQAIASVDVSLGHEHSKVTTEQVLPGNVGSQTGLIAHERETGQGSEGGQRGDAGESKPASSREVDYQLGRRVEQVVSAAGGISHLSVAVVVRRPLEPAQLERLKELVAVAAGINRTRGDALAVYSMDQLGTTSDSAKPVATPLALDAASAEPIKPERSDAAGTASPAPSGISPLTLMLAVVGTLLLSGLVWRARPAATRSLSEVERQRLLGQLQAWMAKPDAANTKPGEDA
ncbi:flagellar basal-body MS-ring/collar protein FliF [Chitinimonas sp.]|uniref:flagellar basal-body MS-ring/collar protein FliF n=1 Tax=Chitinimonas sp. TaxID=1934313 RepID=UPI0035ADAAAD